MTRQFPGDIPITTRIEPRAYDRYFLSYTGVKLPLRLLTPLEPAEIANRNTYFGADFDENERLVLVHKVVYGAVDLEHKYHYHDNGVIRRAEIYDAGDSDEGIRVLCFDEEGRPSAA